MQRKDKIQFLIIACGILLLMGFYFFTNQEPKKSISIPKIRELKEKNRNKLHSYEKEALEKKKNQKSLLSLNFPNLREKEEKKDLLSKEESQKEQISLRSEKKEFNNLIGQAPKKEKAIKNKTYFIKNKTKKPQKNKQHYQLSL